MQVMTEQEQVDHAENKLVVQGCLSALRLAGLDDEDIQVAVARLENWLAENDNRWVK